MNSHFTILSSFTSLVLELLSVSRMMRRVLFCFVFWLAFDEVQLTSFHLCAVHAPVSSASTWTNFPPVISSGHLVFSLALQVPFRTAHPLFHSLPSSTPHSETEILSALSPPHHKEWEFAKVALSSPPHSCQCYPTVETKCWFQDIDQQTPMWVIDMGVFRMGEEIEILWKTWSAL